jgi:hypothetical protein
MYKKHIVIATSLIWIVIGEVKLTYYNSYTSDTPGKRHAWHNDSFYSPIDIEHDLKLAREKRAAKRQQQIEQERIRLRIAKVAQLHSKRVSVNGISEAFGICKSK